VGECVGTHSGLGRGFCPGVVGAPPWVARGGASSSRPDNFGALRHKTECWRALQGSFQRPTQEPLLAHCGG